MAVQIQPEKIKRTSKLDKVITVKISRQFQFSKCPGVKHSTSKNSARPDSATRLLQMLTSSTFNSL